MNAIQLTKNKMDLDNPKIANHPLFPDNNKQKMVIFYNRRKKYNEIYLQKNKIDLNNRKMKNNLPFPDSCGIKYT